jgi:hypothetical protein
MRDRGIVTPQFPKQHLRAPNPEATSLFPEWRQTTGVENEEMRNEENEKVGDQQAVVHKYLPSTIRISSTNTHVVREGRRFTHVPHDRLLLGMTKNQGSRIIRMLYEIIRLSTQKGGKGIMTSGNQNL